MRSYRTIKDLKAQGKLDRPGQYAVGPNLYLAVSKWLTTSWLFRYVDAAGASHWLGLGPHPLVSLTEARIAADKKRLEVYHGADPLAERAASAKARKAEAQAAKAGAVTFKSAAIEYIATNRAGWRDGPNGSSGKDWRATMDADVFPIFGDKPASAINVDDVKASLDRIVSRGALETAHRVRARIENILARANHKNPAYHNPAESEHLLPPRKGNKKVKHHASLDYRELPKFMKELRADKSILARALEFAILAGSRSGEVREATWSEINLDAKTWRIPGSRMKSGRDHTVPLCDRAVDLLAKLPRDGEYIFPSSKAGTAIGKNSFGDLIETMGYKDKATAHGFRATFKTWATETTDASQVVIEMCIAHKIGGSLEKAYQRGDLLAKRRELMDQWCRYCSGLLGGRRPSRRPGR